jgi:S1-C subfamily serine protease
VVAGREASAPKIARMPTTLPPSTPPKPQESVERIYRRVAPGVVFIEARGRERPSSPFGPPNRGRDAGGSGFVVSKGYVVTNFHIVESARRVRVRVGEQGKAAAVEARVVGTDPSTDIALLKTDLRDNRARPLSLGDSSKAAVGDPTIAIGNPLGFDRSVTTGIVSAIQRRIPAPNNFSIADVIQTDAPINPGNSGGPLLDGQGRVIGITAQIATDEESRGGSGIGFAIPVNTLRKVLPELRKNGRVERPYIGVATVSVADLPRDVGIPARNGALVESVEPQSPAEKAGLRAGHTRTDEGVTLGGDLITSVAGKSVSGSEDVARAIEGKRPGDKVQIVFQRGERREEVDLVLERRPARVRDSQGRP